MRARRTGGRFASWYFARSGVSAERPASGRAAILGLAEDDPELLELFGEPRGPEPIAAGEAVRPRGDCAAMARRRTFATGGADEWPRCSSGRRSTFGSMSPRASRDDMLAAVRRRRADAAQPVGHTPAGRQPGRRPSSFHGRPGRSPGRGQPADRAGLRARRMAKVLDLCAGAGGKTLALAAAAPGAQILATDTQPGAAFEARAAGRTGRSAESRPGCSSPPQRAGRARRLERQADLVLVDAPCSGSGTWRRNPEGRWRLTPERLERLVACSRDFSISAAELVRPGGRIVYAVCSMLSREGAGQTEDFLSRHSSWIVQETPIRRGAFGRRRAGS